MRRYMQDMKTGQWYNSVCDFIENKILQFFFNRNASFFVRVRAFILCTCVRMWRCAMFVYRYTKYMDNFSPIFFFFVGDFSYTIWYYRRRYIPRTLHPHFFSICFHLCCEKKICCSSFHFQFVWVNEKQFHYIHKLDGLRPTQSTSSIQYKCMYA